MTRHLGHRVLLAIQATIAMTVIAAAGSPGLAVLSASAAGAVLLTRQRGIRSLAVSAVTTVALVAVLTIPASSAHPSKADNRPVTTHRACARSRAQRCRRG